MASVTGCRCRFDNRQPNALPFTHLQNKCHTTLKVLLLRLSSLRDTAASSTHRLLADLILTAAPDAVVDFAFLPPTRAARVTGLFSGRELSGFDLILVTNSFVQEAINLPWLLHANGIAPWASDRPEAFPPLLLGGSNAFAAQCLAQTSGQAVPDAFFFGEAEESLPHFIRRWKTAIGNKSTRLRQASEGLDGFWVTGTIPALPIRQAVARTPPPPAALLPLLDTEASGTIRLTVGLGCAAFCSFCFEGYERKPYREHAVDALLTQAKSLKRSCGARVAELDAFNLNNFAKLSELVEKCARLFEKISFKSQRADGIAACPEIIDLERAAGKSSFTLGIEGISARTRAFLSKSLTDTEISSAIKALLDRRVRELKLFFILTAYETPEDLAAFSDFCLRLKGWLGQPNAGTRVVLSFGRLVRMPNTPLSYDRLFLEDEEWRFSVDGVAAACRRAQLECRFAFDYPDYLGTQLLAACGHDAAEAVVALACGGLSYHGPWRTEEAAILRAAIPLSATGHAADPAFPFVRRAVSETFLAEQWKAAQQALDKGYCLGATCLGCGACADATERKALTDRIRTPTVTEELIATVARIEADKKRLKPIYLRAILPEDFAGHSPAWVSARILQTLLTRHPEWTENLLAIDEALFSFGENEDKLGIPSGETVLMFKAWDSAAIRATLVSEQSEDLHFAPVLSDTFTPGTFSHALWELHTKANPREAGQQASVWLKELHLPHTLRRDQEMWRIDLAPAAVKKRCVYELAVRPEEQGSCVSVRFSPKAQLRNLLARLPPADGHPRVSCSEIQL